MVRYELREARRLRDLERVEESRKVLICHEQGGSQYIPGRFRTAQPTNITLGLSRSLPGYNLFKTESKCRAIWAKGLNESNIEHKKEMIARAAVTDLEWQDFQKVHREHEKHLNARLKMVKEAEQKRNAERVREGERKLAESQRRLQKVAAEWEEEGQRRVEAFDAKCKQSEAKVAAAKEQLFSRSCDRDAYVEQCLARRQANLDVFIGKTLESYHKMEDHMAAINAHKEELEKANVREASNKAELAAKERAKVAAMKMEKSRTIGEKVSTRFENLDTYLKGREKERKDFKKEREVQWEKQYGRVKKNVKEMQKEFEEKQYGRVKKNVKEMQKE